MNTREYKKESIYKEYQLRKKIKRLFEEKEELKNQIIVIEKRIKDTKKDIHQIYVNLFELEVTGIAPNNKKQS